MTDRLTRLLDLDAQSGEDSFPIRALFHEEDTRRLKAAAIDIGGWLSRHEVLIALDRFGAPGEDHWPVDIARTELESAPEWEHAGSSFFAMPPIVVGPFGYTFSPLMMAAEMRGEAEERDPHPHHAEAPHPLPATEGRFAGLIRSSDLLGTEVFGPSGHMGEVEDLVIEDMTITGVVAKDGAVLPFSRLRHVAEQGHYVFD